MAKIIKENKLKAEKDRAFIEKSFQNGELKTIGMEIQAIMPPTNPFDKNSSKQKLCIIEKIKDFFDQYIGIVC